MLVLSRRCDTAIQIGPDIKVTVLSIRSRRVKLGIDAPHGVRVWRDEVCRDDARWLEDGEENNNAAERVQAQRR